MSKLTFGKGNAKLSKKIYTFSLPAGHSCPFAFECKASADRETGKIVDGAQQTFRCFAASQEALYGNVRRSRWNNYDILKAMKTSAEMVSAIQGSLPSKATIVRVHVSGDFFNQNYFDAWMEVARNNPEKKFYAYTKSLIYWIKRVNEIPANFELTSSKGGKTDELITQNSLKYVQVVHSVDEAASIGMEIDHDDTHAYESKESFALLLHGTQAKGSLASKSLSILRKAGIGGYSKK